MFAAGESLQCREPKAMHDAARAPCWASTLHAMMLLTKPASFPPPNPIAGLDEEQQGRVIDAMEERKVAAGEEIIK